MAAKILDGKRFAAAISAEVATRVKALAARKLTPTLAVILVGEHAPSQVYVKNKTKGCAAVGIANIEKRFPSTTTEGALLSEITQLNNDPKIHAILVQLPLPAHIDAYRIMAGVAPAKDVDGFHPTNIGRLTLGLPGIRPCTPCGIMALIEAAGVHPSGQRAVVIGRSAIVGKPTALLLTHADATVTLCHSKTADLAAIVQESAIVVAAIGKPRYVQGDWIRPGATVIDVGVNRLPDGSLVGDVDFAAVHRRAAHVSPVPGGVGPMTIAMLLHNTVTLAERADA